VPWRLRRFPALRTGQIDLLARNTTWTLEREAGLGVQFAGVLFYDGQGFMVPARGGAKALAGLKGAAICVEKGTTSAQGLAGYSELAGLDLRPVVVDSAAGVANAFFSGKCRALTGDASQLAAARLRAPGGPQAAVILPERISKEPLGPVVRSGDDSWLSLVRWVLYALIAAEESGITRDNLRERVKDPAVRRELGSAEETSRMLGIEKGWGVRALQSTGNYGEMFERNLGRDSPLKLERGLNNLWTNGGLMYAPPVH
jgi:general L-amino acid transport system substrate-binding protein